MLKIDKLAFKKEITKYYYDILYLFMINSDYECLQNNVKWSKL